MVGEHARPPGFPGLKKLFEDAKGYGMSYPLVPVLNFCSLKSSKSSANIFILSPTLYLGF